jgi:hypothetical protein
MAKFMKRWGAQILALLVFFGLVMLSLGMYLMEEGITEPQELQIYTSVFLTALTALYVFFTFSILRENIRQREQNIQPAFAMRLEGNGVKVTNVGNGPAIDTKISLTLTSQEGRETSSLDNQDIPAGESIHFSNGPFMNIGGDVARGEYPGGEIHLDGSYVDMHQEDQEISSRSYALSEFREWQKQQRQAPRNQLNEMSKELSNINSNLNSIKLEIKNQRGP